jgi:hypothetical protein
MANGQFWLFVALYFLLNFGTYGFDFWLPTITKGFAGVPEALKGCINAIPYLAAIVIMLPV